MTATYDAAGHKTQQSGAARPLKLAR